MTLIEMRIVGMTLISDVTLIAALTLTLILNVNHLTWNQNLSVTLTHLSWIPLLVGGVASLFP